MACCKIMLVVGLHGLVDDAGLCLVLCSEPTPRDLPGASPGMPDPLIRMSDVCSVQAVESPCLSILVPLLVKGLREKAAVVRKTAIIIDNMVKVHCLPDCNDAPLGSCITSVSAGWHSHEVLPGSYVNFS